MILAAVILAGGARASAGPTHGLDRGPVRSPQAVAAIPDFNGDGFADLAAGAPFERVSGQADAGGVNVLYGGTVGLTPTGNQFWTQDSPGILDQAEVGDEFGRRLAVGDFNGDGFTDLAVGVPIDDTETVRGAGAVNVLYGSPAGLAADGNQLWTQDSPGILDRAEVRDQFGFAVGVGDFDGDGYDDLAIGAPAETLDRLEQAGAVTVIYGSPAGLSAEGNQVWTQDSPGIPDLAEAGDRVGDRVKAGDFDADGYADLIISAQREDVGTVLDAGALMVLYGAAEGLTATRSQLWSQDSPDILDQAGRSDLFAEYTTSGDFDGDGYEDLAVGAPGDAVGTAEHAGVVNVLYGSAGGLAAPRNQLWTQDSPGVPDQAEAVDALGRCVVAADFDGDGFADLAMTAHYEDVDGAVDAGAANVLYGSPAGLSAVDSQFWSQASPGVEDQAEEGDQFGRYGGWGDFDGDGFADLALGVPFEDVGPAGDAGGLNVLYGSPAGLTAVGDQFGTQDDPGIEDEAEAGDQLGRYVASPS